MCLCELVPQFVDSLYELILYFDILLVAGTAVVLEGDNAFRYIVCPESLDLFRRPFRKVRIVVRVYKENLSAELILTMMIFLLLIFWSSTACFSSGIGGRRRCSPDA